MIILLHYLICIICNSVIIFKIFTSTNLSSYKVIITYFWIILRGQWNLNSLFSRSLAVPNIEIPPPWENDKRDPSSLGNYERVRTPHLETYFLMPPPSFRMTRLSLSTVRFRRTPQAEKQISWCLASSSAIMNLCTGRVENKCRLVKLRVPRCALFYKWQRGKWGVAHKTGNSARGLNPFFLRLSPCPASGLPTSTASRTCSPSSRSSVPK